MRPVFLGNGLSGSQKAARKASKRRAGGRTVNHKEGVTCTTNFHDRLESLGYPKGGQGFRKTRSRTNERGQNKCCEQNKKSYLEELNHGDVPNKFSSLPGFAWFSSLAFACLPTDIADGRRPLIAHLRTHDDDLHPTMTVAAHPVDPPQLAPDEPAVQLLAGGDAATACESAAWA